MARPAAADGEAQSADRAPERGQQREVRFEAGSVQFDLELKELRLSKDVVVQVDRYRLTSDRLLLRRGPRGLEVEGCGRVALCPCAGAPVTIGFESATVAPPTDLLIEDPTVRVGGVPVLWMPVLWLRAPHRTGLLPPYVAWRGHDGLLAGTGAHLPWGERDDAGQVKSLDLSAGGYLKGGAVVDARLHTAQSTARVRWDHLRQSLLQVDARGSATRDDGAATGAFRIDAIRGPRGRSGTRELEPAARRFDRAEGVVGYFGDRGVAAVGLRTDVERGSGVDQVGAAGPRVHLGYGAALGRVGFADASLGVGTVHDPLFGSATTISHRRSLGLEVQPGPFSTSVQLHNELAAVTTADGAGAGVWLHGRARAGLPLMRGFGSGPDPVLHFVEPFARFDVAHAARSGALPDAAWPGDGGWMAAVGGLTTSLGVFGSRQAGSLTASGGLVGPADDLAPTVGARARVRAAWVGLGADTIWLPRQRGAALSLVRARAGESSGVHLSGYVEGRRDADFRFARWLATDAAFPLRDGWLDAPGWTAGGALNVPWVRWLASSAAIDHDLSQGELLGVRGGTAYRHPCGCLATAAWIGHRIGRPGVDVWFSVDLLP